MDDIQTARRLVVHAVHGTWPYGILCHIVGATPVIPGDSDLPWFLLGSQFQIAVEKEIKCPLAAWVPFRWSGNNSFAARSSAGKALAVHLEDWFRREPECEHVVVAHSHGGSVAVEAVRILDAQGSNRITKVVCMATPFARRWASPKDDGELAARYLLARFGWISLAICAALIVYVRCFFGYSSILDEAYSKFGIFGLYHSCMTLFVIPFFILLWKIGAITTNLGHQPDCDEAQAKSGKWALYAIRAAHDEASLILQASQFINLILGVMLVWGLLLPFGWAKARLLPDGWVSRVRLWIVSSAVLGCLIIVLGDVSGDRFPTDPFELLGALAIILIFMPLLVALIMAWLFSLLVLLATLFVLPSSLVLAMSFGWDIIRDRGLTIVECEPVPSGVRGTVEMLRLSDKDVSGLGLVHYLHAVPTARSCVARILGETDKSR